MFNNIVGPFELAVDWLTDKVYLVQKSLARIDVFTPNGQNRTDLLTSDIFRPTSIALDPNENFLFFTDAGNSGNKLQPPKIERAFMDGTGRHVIVTEKLIEPIAITLDIVKKRVFWIDRKYDHLESCDYYGAKRHIIASGSVNLPHAMSLGIFENTIYYADTTKLAIMKLQRHTMTAQANISYHYKFNGNNESPRNVRVYHATKQLKLRANPCQQNNGGCEHFCLLSHVENTRDAAGNTFRCKCKIGYELSRNLKSCERIRDSIYFSQANSIRGISMNPNMITETRLPIVMPKIAAARAIEVDCKNNLTFYYDPIRKAIFQNKFSGTETPEDSSSSILSKLTICF